MEAALGRLRAALRAADFAALEGITTEIAALTGQIGRGADPAALRRIARLAEANAACLTAAGRGIRAARRRLAELGAGRRLVTYDGAGQRQDRAAEGVPRRRV
ncbi:MAG: hypothetical protein RIT14_1390 [Pseudomonadota bacterium]